MIKLTTANGLKQKLKDRNFAIFPNIIFSRPPDDVKEIHRKGSFALALEWGHWAVILWFIKTNKL